MVKGFPSRFAFNNNARVRRAFPICRRGVHFPCLPGVGPSILTNMNDITRRHFTQSLAAAPAAFLMGCADRGNESASRSQADGADPWDGYDGAMVVDALASPGPFNVQNRTGQPLSAEMVANARASGITAVNVTANGGGGTPEEAYEATLGHLEYWDRETATHPDVLRLASSVTEIHEAKDAGQLALVLGFQDTFMLGTDVERLDEFHAKGVKIIQLTYNVPNLVGEGCLSPSNGGLTDFGKTLVEAMEDRGVLVDLSHCGQRTTAEAIVLAAGPVSITHSGCKAIYDHPRSKRDEELRALADKGGVVGIYMMPFLNAEGPPTAEDLYLHIEHAVNLCGEDHVGIGSDNSTTPTAADEAYLAGLKAFAEERQRLGIGAPREHEVLFVPELNAPERMEMIGEGLIARGHSASRVEKVIGGNWMRLFGEVWG
ncbi:MAG: dipeptidase [Longimicrobiales bacterium]